MTGAPSTGIAAFAIDGDGIRTVELERGPRVRGASVIKPLLFWVGGTVGAEAGITTSDNDATADLWSRVGGEVLLATLDERTGVACTVDGGQGEHPSLRVLVTAGELARAYAALAADDSEVAGQIRGWMRAVRADQTFGLRRIAAEVLDVEEDVVAVKCGWFGGERVHAVVLVEGDGRTIGSVVTTSWQPDGATRAAALEASGDDERLVAVHDALAGDVIRSATRRALLEAAAL